MSKQTNISGSKFGGDWTKQKLLVIDEYLKQYSKVLKNTHTKKIYIDAFAGSGKTELKKKETEVKAGQMGLYDLSEDFKDMKPAAPAAPEVLDRSAMLSLRYDFDEYYFIELDEGRLHELQVRISKEFPQKLGKIHFIAGNSNNEVQTILSNISVRDRCFMFLDPFALELEWKVLEAVSKKVVIDLWYLFPLSALTRVIPKDAAKMNKNERIVSKILGTDEWKLKLYETTGQSDIFGAEQKSRIQYDRLIEYIMERFKTIFPVVSDNYIKLKNENNTKLFLLCFMMTNTSPNAVSLADKLVKGIKTKLERIYGNN